VAEHKHHMDDGRILYEYEVSEGTNQKRIDIVYLTPGQAADVITILGHWLTGGWKLYRVQIPEVTEWAYHYAPSPGSAIELHLADHDMCGYDKALCEEVDAQINVWGFGCILGKENREGHSVQEYAEELDKHHVWEAPDGS